MSHLPKLLKKLSLAFLASLVLVFSFVSTTKASWYNPGYEEWQQKVSTGDDAAIFGERYTQAQVWWVIYGIFSFIQTAPLPPDLRDCVKSGSDKTKFIDCVKAAESFAGSKPSTKASEQTILGALVEDRPISAVSYVRDVGRNMHLVPEAKAQETGIGFSALNPVLSLWKASRNIVYGLLIVAIIGLSFMIMFKVKLNPQTAITVQSAIPRIVIALILITFSYAIAGLLIDLMYVVIAILSLLLSSSGAFGGQLQPQSAVDFFNLLTRGPEVFGIRIGVFGFMARYWLGFIVDTVLITLFADSPIVVLGGILGIVIAIVSVIILIIIGIKIIWMLFKAMAEILLSTIFAPFQIFVGTLVPNMGFSTWLRNYIATLSVFPVAGILLVLASLFLTMSINSAANGILDFGIIGQVVRSFTQPQQANFQAYWPPLLGSSDVNTTNAIVFLGASFVIITIIPKTAEFIQALIKGGQFNYGAAITEATIQPLATALNIGAASKQIGEMWTTEFGTRIPGRPETGIITKARNRATGPGRAPIPS